MGKAIVLALDDHGGPGERELLRQVAADPRTKPALGARSIRDALAERLTTSRMLGAWRRGVQDRHLPRSGVRRSTRIEQGFTRCFTMPSTRTGARDDRARMAELLRPLYAGAERPRA